MAPELLANGVPSVRTDMFAFGVILAEMLSGHHPAAGASTTSRDAGLQHIADRARDADPARRYATAGELVAALEASNPIASSRFWWEFHQGAVAVSYAGMLVPAWFAKQQIGGLEGRSFFIATAVAALVASMLRLHLWFMSRQHAGELAWARRRSAPAWWRRSPCSTWCCSCSPSASPSRSPSSSRPRHARQGSTDPSQGIVRADSNLRGGRLQPARLVEGGLQTRGFPTKATTLGAAATVETTTRGTNRNPTNMKPPRSAISRSPAAIHIQ
jgi:hypothetical protein